MKAVRIRNLRLTTPHMRGSDVKAVQTLVGPLVGRAVLVDGEFGPATGSAIAYWKRYVAGYPERMLSNGHASVIGQPGYDMLSGARKAPAAWRVRAAARRRKLPKHVIPVGQAGVMWAGEYVGCTESPAGSNRVPRLQDLARSLKLPAWLVRMGWPWCSYFVMVTDLRAGGKAAAAGLVRGEFNALYVPEVLAQAQAGRHGLSVVGRSEVRAGDKVAFNFPGTSSLADHIGHMRGPVRPNGTFPTREGNTSSGTGGSQDNGGGVFDRERDMSIVAGFIRVT